MSFFCPGFYFFECFLEFEVSYSFFNKVSDLFAPLCWVLFHCFFKFTVYAYGYCYRHCATTVTQFVIQIHKRSCRTDCLQNAWPIYNLGSFDISCVLSKSSSNVYISATLFCFMMSMASASLGSSFRSSPSSVATRYCSRVTP